MVDLDKLVCDFLNPGELLGKEDIKRIEDKMNESPYRNYTYFLIQEALEASLKKQGLEYKDGSLHYIGEEEKPSTIKFDEEKPQTFEDISKNGGVDMGRPTKLTIPQSDSFWTDKEIEQLEKETDEGTDKIEKDLRKILFAKEPDFQSMIDEFAKTMNNGGHEVSVSETLAYYMGLQTMWNKLKNG